MRLRSLLAASLLVIPTASYADLFDCTHKATRKISAPGAGVTRVVIRARAGSLRVTGRSGVTDVLATGMACASDKDDLQGIQLKSERHGSELLIEAVIPEKSSFFGTGQARLDLEVVLPAGAAVSVEDGSGSAEINDVGSLTVVDGSGSLKIRGVRGDAKVKDGSGSIEISGVSGNVEIRDGSGSMDIEDIGGSVLIDADGSGGVSVNNVRGDFEVRRKGSGGVDYERIGGRISVPERHRD